MAQPQQPSLYVQVVTTSGEVYAGQADEVIAPGSEGQLGILPRHAPLMTTLKVGALIIKHGGAAEETLFIGGGFMEVADNRIIVLADDAERASDIDEARAQEARRRAEQDLEQARSDVDRAALTGEIERALGRLRVAEIQRTRRTRRTPEPGGSDL
jgi:F-type H+-transporting ATPase subunit epsilon